MKAIRVLFVLVMAAIVIVGGTGCQTSFGGPGGFNGVVIHNMNADADLVTVTVNGCQIQRLTMRIGMTVQDPICFAEVGSSRDYAFTAYKRDPATGQMTISGFKLVRVQFDSYRSLVGNGYGGGSSVKSIVLTTEGWESQNKLRVQGHPDTYAY